MLTDENYTNIINKKRLTEEFCKLTAIDSISFNERKMADYLKTELNKIGADVFEDNAGHFYGSNTGNLYGFLKGDIKGEPILFSAHMDTVNPGIGKRAYVGSDGRITSSGETVLGADDMAGVAAILEALKTIKENNISHRRIEFLFSIAEEAYIKGTSVFDFTKLNSKVGYVLDLSGENGTAALQAPTLISFKAQVIGRSAHAGFSPEKGINAIAVTAEAVSKLKQGRIGKETTFNIGTIAGGTSANIVSENCVVKGEIRSLDHIKALKTVESIKIEFEKSCKKYNAELKYDYNIDLEAYNIDKESNVVKRYENACKQLGINTNFISTFGGSDNNNFVKNGIEGIVVACGYNNAHTNSEYITVSELEKTANVVLKLMTM